MEGVIDVYPNKKEIGHISVDSNWVNKFLGTNLSKEEMKRCLDLVDLKTEIKEDSLEITIPTYKVDI